MVGLAFTAGCASQTRVVSDNTVAHKFAALGRNGWAVSGGGLDEPRNAPSARANVRYSDNAPSIFGESNIQWKTNFHTDEPSPAAPAAPAPPPLTVDPNTGLPLAR